MHILGTSSISSASSVQNINRFLLNHVHCEWRTLQKYSDTLPSSRSGAEYMQRHCCCNWESAFAAAKGWEGGLEGDGCGQ